jgi:hypothetical protein
MVGLMAVLMESLMADPTVDQMVGLMAVLTESSMADPMVDTMVLWMVDRTVD